jgi:hypothetical protein
LVVPRLWSAIGLAGVGANLQGLQIVPRSAAVVAFDDDLLDDGHGINGDRSQRLTTRRLRAMWFESRSCRLDRVSYGDGDDRFGLEIEEQPIEPSIERVTRDCGQSLCRKAHRRLSMGTPMPALRPNVILLNGNDDMPDVVPD